MTLANKTLKADGSLDGAGGSPVRSPQFLEDLYDAVVALQATIGVTTPTWTSGTGDPETVVTAPVGSLYSRTDGGAGTTLYVKESGASNTGWVAMVTYPGP
jgi:hypothetical protein